jgi:hypothetical protein
VEVYRLESILAFCCVPQSQNNINSAKPRGWELGIFKMAPLPPSIAQSGVGRLGWLGFLLSYIIGNVRVGVGSRGQSL